jgi:hypothetical protein
MLQDIHNHYLNKGESILCGIRVSNLIFIKSLYFQPIF